MQRSVFFSTFLIAAVLSPITLQPYTCGPPPAEARLAVLELRVGDFHGENVIEGFNPNLFSYEARFPESESVGVLWVKANHPSTMIDVEYDGMPVRLVGQSVAELDVPLGSSELTIVVTRLGATPDSRTYVVHIERVPVFACTEQGIREAIARGGGPIYFDCDEPTVVPTEAEIVIDNDVILDGEGNLIVDGGSAVPPTAGEVAPKVNGAHRVFSISEGVTAELIGFTVTGGSTPGDGGGILNAGTFTLADSTVTENSAERAGGVGNLESGVLAVVGSTVTSNTASLVGGIGNLGMAEVIDTTVSLNTATTDGGGVGNAAEATMTITDSIVRSNTAGGQAGGIGSEALGVLILTNTTVADNQAETNGGVTSGGKLTMNDCVVSGNFASLATAGIAIGEEGTATLTRVTVSGNSTDGFAGGIWIGGSLTVVDSVVSQNTAVLDGGGIYNLGVLSLTSSSVSGNSADLGGGVLNLEIGILSIADSTVSENTAARFGGGIRNLGLAEVTDTVVSDNTAMVAAGGISNRLEAAIMTLSRSTIQGNTALGNVGGIANGGMLTLNDTTVSGNEAGGEAGGIRNSATGTVTLTDSTVSGNTATAQGGGIVNDAILTLSDSMISFNSAGADGGGILNSGTLIVMRSTIAENTGATSGGGIENYSGSIEIDSSTVSGNTATAGGGGAIENPFPQGTLLLTNTTVSGNSSIGRGAIENAGSAVVIASTLSLNVADGTVLWDGACLLAPECPPGALTIRNTILDGPCIGASDVLSLGGNIESPGNTCSLIPGIDLINVRATQLGLGPLANNGGPTKTQALAPFSVALDRIFEPECVDGNGFPLLTDQRGVPRPHGPACDSGAFELEDGPQPTGACINDADRATYEMLVYVNGDGVPAACIDAAAAIGADCIFGSAASSPPLEGCGTEAGAVLGCFPNCTEEVIGQLAGCVANCTAGATGLSGGCVTCYGDAVACGAAFCTPQCVSDVNSPQCIECRTENGCISGFDTCSGLPGDIDCSGTGGTGGTGGNNPPVIDYVAWEYGVDCEGFGATTLQVTVSANDADDPTGETLTYSGSLQWCDPFSVTSTPSPVTETVNCELSLGLESLAVTVADPQGNEDTISAFFESALCQGGCVENPEGELGCPGGTGGTGGAGGTGGSGGTAGTGGAPMLCADGQLRCSADLARIEICFNDVWEHFEDCPPPSECKEEPDVSCVEPSVIVGDGIWQGNGHQYVVVEFRGQTWNTANADLSAQLPGYHLATITSQEEQDFVDNLVAGLASGELWLGGFQDPITELNPAAGWTWVTGEPWAYTNWLSGEPNDTIGVEQHLALDRGGWNDEGSAIGAVGGYLAESFDPVAP